MIVTKIIQGLLLDQVFLYMCQENLVVMLADAITMVKSLVGFLLKVIWLLLEKKLIPLEKHIGNLGIVKNVMTF